MTKNTFLLLTLTIPLLTIGAGCASPDTNSQTGAGYSTTSAASATTTSTELMATFKNSAGSMYINPIYRFSLNLPKSWGDILITQGLENSAQRQSKIHDSIRLTSKNDPQRYIRIQMVKIADKSDSLALGGTQLRSLSDDSDYAFYYSGSQDMADAGGNKATKEQLIIMAEIAAITKSFTFIY